MCPAINFLVTTRKTRDPASPPQNPLTPDLPSSPALYGNFLFLHPIFLEGESRDEAGSHSIAQAGLELTVSLLP